MRYISSIRGLAIALMMFGPCGAVAVWRPAAAQEVREEPRKAAPEDAAQRKARDDLNRAGVSDKAIGAVKKEFEPTPPSQPQGAAKFEPEKDEHPDHHHNPCDNPKMPAEVEQCK
jgi:hypothetical protein